MTFFLLREVPCGSATFTIGGGLSGNNKLTDKIILNFRSVVGGIGS